MRKDSEKITDELRANFLRKGGYVTFPRPEDQHLQKKVDAMTDSELVDWAIENNSCPAYWSEEPTKTSSVPQRNGLFFKARGDRNRIDQCIKNQ